MWACSCCVSTREENDVESGAGWFCRNHLVFVPEAAALGELDDKIWVWKADDSTPVTGHVTRSGRATTPTAVPSTAAGVACSVLLCVWPTDTESSDGYGASSDGYGAQADQAILKVSSPMLTAISSLPPKAWT